MRAVVLVHGGAGAREGSEEEIEALGQACLAAAQEGFRALERGGCALDTVQAATQRLEDDVRFNAGTGSSLNSSGEVEMDAALMEGERLRAGAVALIRRFKNPIQIARCVLEQSPHVLLAGPGAETFALEMGCAACEPSQLITERSLERWRKNQGKPYPSSGTVGAVALDFRGHLAAATSTGGVLGKRPGRIGDSPLPGCGTYADDLAGAVSATGWGEGIIRVALGKFVCEQMRQGALPGQAAEYGLKELQRVGGRGGMIVVRTDGEFAFARNTERMSHAWVHSDKGEGFGS